MSGIPKGTVTFLFTDIEGSTRMWEQHPRAMQTALARHDILLREVIEQHGGHIFKTVGDAFCAAFYTAPEALEAALDAQRALRDADWSALGVEPVKARMALHTGVAEVRDNDYFGLPLNRVARLLSTGYGGQILLSLATQQLVRDHLPTGAGLKDLGEGGLKDLVRAEHVYQVVAPDLPMEFPPLKSLDTRYVEPEATGVSMTAQGTAHNPYKGLRAFMEADALDFFGREALTERLLGRVAEKGDFTRFLAVVGPSGSGKSSVVRAGLVPALKAGKVPCSERWPVVEILPGTHPLEELEAVLLGIASGPNAPETLIGQMNEDERGLVRAVKRVLPRDESVELTIVIDQFEELFTLVESEQVRTHFLNSLYAAVTDLRSRLRVIVTLRADFFDRPLTYPDLGELMRQRTAVVLPLLPEELEWAIVRPAQRVGVSLEAELLTAIVQDISEQPGALPLLQYALTELFERRTGRIMTLEAYQASGGVLGALARRADEIYTDLTPDEQETARQIFLRLVTLGEGMEDTRRRVRLSELSSAMGTRLGAEGSQVLERALDAFGRYRLLTFDRDPVTHGPTVEVAHEALIQTWDRLGEWLDESRLNLRVQRQLMMASTEWANAGKDRSFLASGARRTQFEALAQMAERRGGLALTQEERDYLAASLEEQERQEVTERERQRHELELQKRAASRLRVLVGAMAIFLVVAVVLSGFALNQSQVAQDTFTLADAQRLASEASTLLYQGARPELIALLSIHSMRTRYSPQADAALAGAMTLIYPKQLFVGHADRVHMVRFSHDGTHAITSSFDKTIRVWDVQAGKELRAFTAYSDYDDARKGFAVSPDGRYVLTANKDYTAKLFDVHSGVEARSFIGHADDVTSAVFSTDGRYVLTSSSDKTARLWDAQAGTTLHNLIGHEGSVNRAIFSPDGKTVLTISQDKTTRLWDAQTGAELRRFTSHTDAVTAASFSPDGNWILTGSSDGSARLWNSQTGQESHQFPGGDYGWTAVSFSPDGKKIIAASGIGGLKTWDADTGDQLWHFNYQSQLNTVALSPDGEIVAVGGADNRLWLLDINTGADLRRFAAHTSQLYGVAFSPDGKYLLTGAWDNTAILWDTEPVSPLPQFLGHTGALHMVSFAPPDEEYIFTTSADRTVRQWNTQTGSEVRSFTGHAGPVLGLAVSSNSKTLLTSGLDPDKTARLWDVQTGKELRRFSPGAEPFGVALSPDGKYAFIGLTGDNVARLWDLQNGNEVRQFDPAYKGAHKGEYGVAISPDGKYAATANFDKIVRLWDIQTGAEVRQFKGHTDFIFGVEFSPGGERLLTAGFDRTARLWDVETGKELRRFAGHTGGVGWADLSADGKLVVTAGADHTARLWYVDYRDNIRYLCGRLLRALTDDERAQYGIKNNEPTCPKE